MMEDQLTNSSNLSSNRLTCKSYQCKNQSRNMDVVRGLRSVFRNYPCCNSMCNCVRCGSLNLTNIINCWPSTNVETTGFYKFLARFSGRRRLLQKQFKNLATYTTIFLLLLIAGVTDACSSRTTPRPRPPTPTPRPNVTFHTYKCPPAYAAWYCLNEATCFTVKIGDSLLYNCECADGYMGPRCEYKDLDGSYLPTRPRVMLETASIASGATIILFLVIIMSVYVYVQCHQKQKKFGLHQSHLQTNGNGYDTVDGLQMVRSMPELRPFGPHHQKVIPMADAFVNS